MPTPPAKNGAGEFALIAGIVALACSVVPIVGEFVSAPAAVVAIAAGWIGINRVDRGLATNPGAAWIGLALGVLAGFITALVLLATSNVGQETVSGSTHSRTDLWT